MISKQVFSDNTVALGELFPNFSHEFLEPFEHIITEGINHELHLDFDITGRSHDKISPILRLARPEDAKELVNIYQELYSGTYPYKEMEDVNEVCKMIEDPHIQWVIYQDPLYNIAGCITFVLDFENKRGYIRGFMLKKKYQGYIDITKAMVGSMLGMLHKYKNVIFTWYVENRTAHAKSQYSMYVCGIAPIGFYPNKDVFFGKVESDLMQILYDERALKDLRSPEIPQLIPQVESCFQYSKKRYNLKEARFEKPKFQLNKLLIRKLQKKIYREVLRDKFGYETITFRLNNSDSYFQFLYTPQVQNFEKTKYKINNLEELCAFVKEFLSCKKELGIRYCEIFLSAYEREHQQIFYNAGFRPRGYIPSWTFSENLVFKDAILFSLCEGVINNNIQLIDEGCKLVTCLGIAKFSEKQECIEISSPKRIGKNLGEKVSEIVINSEKHIKRSLMVSMCVYLVLLFASTQVTPGFDIVIHTISDLGNLLYTPAPYLFDTACAFAGVITIPYSFYIWKRMMKGITRVRIITWFGLGFGIIGGIGYSCVGIFSLERAGPDGLVHSIAAIVAFSGFVFSIMFFSISILSKNHWMYIIFGVSGMILPLVLLCINIIIPTPFFEWLLLISILGFIVPLNYWSIKF